MTCCRIQYDARCGRQGMYMFANNPDLSYCKRHREPGMILLYPPSQGSVTYASSTSHVHTRTHLGMTAAEYIYTVEFRSIFRLPSGNPPPTSDYAFDDWRFDTIPREEVEIPILHDILPDTPPRPFPRRLYAEDPIVASFLV